MACLGFIMMTAVLVTAGATPSANEQSVKDLKDAVKELCQRAEISRQGQRAAVRAVLRTTTITVDAPIKMTPLQQTAYDYDNTTGKYTVPFSGWYSVAYQLYPRTNATTMNADLFNNGDMVARARCSDDGHTKEYPYTCHSSLALHLQAGDRLWVQSSHSGPYATSSFDSFLTFVLVSPDH